MSDGREVFDGRRIDRKIFDICKLPYKAIIWRNKAVLWRRAIFVKSKRYKKIKSVTYSGGRREEEVMPSMHTKPGSSYHDPGHHRSSIAPNKPFKGRHGHKSKSAIKAANKGIPSPPVPSRSEADYDRESRECRACDCIQT